MRYGTAPGATPDTILHLPLRRDALTSDRSASAQTVTLAGTNSAVPTTAPGMYGPGVEFERDSTDLARRIEVADSASLDATPDLTLECFLYQTADDATVETRIFTRIGSGASIFKVWLAASTHLLNFKIWNAAQTAETITASGYKLDLARWHHVRAVADLTNGFLYLMVDGQIVARAVSALADIATGAATEVLEIGSAANGTDDARCLGRMSDIRMFNTAETDPATCPVNIQPDRVSRRAWFTYEWDLREDLAGESWTDDTLGTSGGYSLATFDLETLVPHANDMLTVVGVSSILAEGDTPVVHTEVGAREDIGTTANSFAYYQDTLYCDLDPATLNKLLVHVRARASEKTERTGGRLVAGAVMQAGPIEVRTALPGSPMPTGGGGSFTLDATRSEWPTDWREHSLSKVYWRGSRARVWLMVDGVAKTDARQVLDGFVEAIPTRSDRGLLQVPLTAAYYRLRDAPSLGVRLATAAEFPSMNPLLGGAPFVLVLGNQQQRVPTIRVGTQPTGEPMHRVVPTGFGGLTLIGQSGVRDQVNIDLDEGTFEIDLGFADASVVVVSGAGEPGTPTSAGPNRYFGDPGDAFLDYGAQIQFVLKNIFGFSASEMDAASLADTQTRVGVGRNEALILDGSVDFGQWLADSLDQGQVFLVFKRNTSSGLVAIKDLNKADTDRIVQPADVLTSTWSETNELMVTRITAEYQERQTLGLVDVPKQVAPRNYDTHEEFAITAERNIETGFDTDTDTDLWLDAREDLYRGPLKTHSARLSPRFNDLEILDALTMAALADVPSGAAPEVRPLLTAFHNDGTIAPLSFSTGPFATDGTSAANSRQEFEPTMIYTKGDDTPLPLADTLDVWTDVDDEWWSQFVTYGAGGYTVGHSSTCKHRLAILAKRIGGSADTDLLFRLTLDDGTVLATTAAGHTTAAGGVFDALLSAAGGFTSLPTDALDILKLQYKANSCTGELLAASAEGQEPTATTALSEPMPRTLWSDWYDNGGITAATSAGKIASIPCAWSAGLIQRRNVIWDQYNIYVYIDATSATGTWRLGWQSAMYDELYPATAPNILLDQAVTNGGTETLQYINPFGSFFMDAHLYVHTAGGGTLKIHGVNQTYQRRTGNYNSYSAVLGQWSSDSFSGWSIPTGSWLNVGGTHQFIRQGGTAIPGYLNNGGTGKLALAGMMRSDGGTVPQFRVYDITNSVEVIPAFTPTGATTTNVWRTWFDDDALGAGTLPTDDALLQIQLNRTAGGNSAELMAANFFAYHHE